MTKELRETSTELLVSKDYITMEDETLFHKMNYWMGEDQNPERSPRSREDAKRIIGRLACELGVRAREEKDLEQMFEGSV